MGDKEVTLSSDALPRGRHSLHHQVYCIITVTRGHHPLFTDITAAGLVRNIGYYSHWDGIWMTDDDETPLVE